MRARELKRVADTYADANIYVAPHAGA